MVLPCAQFTSGCVFSSVEMRFCLYSLFFVTTGRNQGIELLHQYINENTLIITIIRGLVQPPYVESGCGYVSRASVTAARFETSTYREERGEEREKEGGLVVCS